MISASDIERLAALARLKLSPEETERLCKDTEAILEYVSQIQKISGERGGESEVSSAGTPENVMREDARPHESGIYTEMLLAAAPQREGNYVKVKKIL